MFTGPEIPDVVAEALRDRISSQSWWKQHSNTVSAGLTGLVTFVWWLTAMRVELPSTVTLGVGGLLAVGGALGVFRTKNGVTPSTADTILGDLHSLYDVEPYGRHAKPE